MTRTGTVLLNTATNYARFAATMAVVFVLTPIIIDAVGEEDFGLWTLVFSTVGFFGLLDMGFATAVVKYVAECRGSNESEKRNRILSTLMGAYVMLAVLAAVGVGGLSLVFNSFFEIPPERHGDALMLLWIIAFRAVVLALPLGTFRGVLFGEQRIWMINAVQVGTNLTYGISVWVALSFGGGLFELAVLNLVTMVVEHAIYFVMAKRCVPDLRISLRLADWKAFREVASFSMFAFLGQMAALILFKTDPIIIKVFMPLSAVAVYAVALKVSESAHLFTKQFVNVLSPVVAQLHGEKDHGRIRRVLVEGSRLALAPGLAISVPLWCFASEALEFWIGPRFVEGAAVMAILVVAGTVAIPQMVASNILSMAGRHRYTARCAVVAMILNVGISVLLVGAFDMGLIGVALGTLAAALIVDVAMVVRTACSAYGVSFASYSAKALLPPLIPAALQAALTLAIKAAWPPENLFHIAVACIPGGLVFMIAAWFTCLGPEDRDRLKHMVARKEPQPAPEVAPVEAKEEEPVCVS